MGLRLLHFCLMLAFSHSGSYKTTPSTLDQALDEIVREKCLEKRGYKALDDNITFFRLVEAVTGADVVFPCSYCGENYEDSTRVWRWRSRGVNADEQEVKLGLGANLTDNRLFTLPDHSLTIRNVSTNDTGMYYCRSLEEDEMVVFQFSLDLVLPDVPVETETKEFSWEKYVAKSITGVSKSIYLQDNAELNNFLDKVKLKVSSEWDPWLPCDGCTKLRKRFAKCRIRLKLNRVKYSEIKENNLDETQKFLYRFMVVSCHSTDLEKWLPSLFTLTSKVPNFLQTQPCYGDCLHKDRLLHEPKYYLDLELDEGEAQFFICPESNLRSKITWRKDGVVLKPVSTIGKTKKNKVLNKILLKNNPSSGRVGTFVDRMNILHLTRVAMKDAGVFICYVNNVPMKGFNVTVMSAEETKQQRYYHFWLLSTYSALLSTIIVATGIVYGYFRKDMFVAVTEDRLPLLNDEDLE